MFQWMEVLAQGPVAKAILALSIVAAGGLAFGSLGDRGIRLGAAGVLFAGIFFGQLGMHIDERILEFVRDFGLLLFVYTVGLQVGPGFFSSVKQRGLQLNALGAAIVLLGGLIVAGFRFLFSLLGAGRWRLIRWCDDKYTEPRSRTGCAPEPSRPRPGSGRLSRHGLRRCLSFWHCRDHRDDAVGASSIFHRR
jgi:hypothetical protein